MLLPFKHRKMAPFCPSPKTSTPRPGLQRSASIAGITAFSQRRSTRQNFRHHPYSQRPTNSVRRGSTEGKKDWALHKTKSTFSKPKLSKVKRQTNWSQDSDQGKAVRSWSVSQVASLLQCNLTLNSMDLFNTDSMSLDNMCCQTANTATTSSENKCQAVSDSDNNQLDETEVSKKTHEQDASDLRGNKHTGQLMNEPLDFRKHTPASKKTPLKPIVPNQCAPVQMPTPPLFSNISLGSLFTTPAHPQALAVVDANVHNANHASSVDQNNNSSNNNSSEIQEHPSDGEETMDGEAASTDDLTSDIQIWAPSFNDVSLWSCLYHDNTSTGNVTEHDSTPQDSEKDLENNPGVLPSLRKQDTVILLMDEDITQRARTPASDDEDALACLPVWLEEDQDDEEDVLNSSGNEYRGLIQPSRSFCCNVCGSRLDRMTLFDLLAFGDNEMPLSPGSVRDDMLLFCPECESARCVFGANRLI